MTENDIDINRMIEEAEAKGRELESVDARNRRRRAKGRKPLPDHQEREDEKVSRRRYRTGDDTTVEGGDAIKLFELRKERMEGGDDPDDVDDREAREERAEREKRKEKPSSPARPGRSVENAVRDAEAARRAQDLKNGRIDHAGNWSEGGQRLEGGDPATVVDSLGLAKAWGLSPDPEALAVAAGAGADPAPAASATSASLLEAFAKDLYRRLGTSFDAIERTLSDLQGRVSEILSDAARSAGQGEEARSPSSEFEELLARRTPVVFDIGGTKMTFDAITVFYAPPCITLVSKIGSAKITPKPGAQLLLSYETDGKRYENDPVTFLGTRFDLPMFGLSFVGFVRDLDADMIDVAAGVKGP